jgi:hypothetical protein
MSCVELCFESYLVQVVRPIWAIFSAAWEQHSDTDKANLILNGKSLEQIITTESDKLVVNNVLKAKVLTCLPGLKSKLAIPILIRFCATTCLTISYREITYAELSQQIQQRFNTSIEGFIGQWYREKEIPAYAWTEPKLEQGVKDDQTVYTLRMQISNHGKAHGLVKLSIQLGEEAWRKRWLRWRLLVVVSAAFWWRTS